MFNPFKKNFSFIASAFLATGFITTKSYICA